MTDTRIWPQPKLVAIGGGTGTSTILPGIKKRTELITAIISVLDDGGSTGRLRKDLGILAPGDIRNCLVSLANADGIMEKLFDYRFEEGELKGHSFGNIFLAAINGVFKDMNKAILYTSDILSITGRVLPMTLTPAVLIAELENGSFVRGESKIGAACIDQDTKIKRIFSEPKKLELHEDAKDAILEADIILLGPGSLYTSILPNLLAEGMVDYIEKSKAKKIYIANIMTEPGETDGYSIKDHYQAIYDQVGGQIIDTIVVNKGPIDQDLFERYEKTGASPLVLKDDERAYFESKGIDIYEGDFALVRKGLIRHDGEKLSDLIFNVIME